MSLIFSNFGWGSLQQFGLKGSTIIVYFILARLLGAEAIGLISFAFAILAISEILITRGLPESIIQGDTLNSKQVNALFINCYIWAAGVFFVIQIVASLYAAQDREISEVVRALSLLLFLRPAITIHTALARKEFKFKEIAKIVFISALISDTVAIYLAYSWASIWALVVSVYIKFIILNICFTRLNLIKHSLSYNYDSIKQTLLYSQEVFKTKLLSFLTLRADEIIIGAFLGMTELGYYSMIMKIARAFEDTVMQPFNNVMLNVFSRAKNSMFAALDILYRAINILVTVSVPCFLILSLGGNDLIPLVLGSEWVIGEALYFFVGLHMSIRSLAYLFHSFLIATGFARYVVWGTFISFIMTILMLVPLSKYGIYHIGFGVFVRAFIGLILSLLFMSKIKLFNIVKYFKKIKYHLLLLIMISLYFSFLSLFEYDQSFQTALILCFIIAFIYLPLNIFDKGKVLINDYRFIKSWKN